MAIVEKLQMKTAFIAAVSGFDTGMSNEVVSSLRPVLHSIWLIPSQRADKIFYCTIKLFPKRRLQKIY